MNSLHLCFLMQNFYAFILFVLMINFLTWLVHFSQRIWENTMFYQWTGLYKTYKRGTGACTVQGSKFDICTSTLCVHSGYRARTEDCGNVDVTGEICSRDFRDGQGWSVRTESCKY